MTAGGILILNGSSVRSASFGGIIRTLEEVFRLPAFLRRANLNLAATYDPSRGQSNSTAILSQILDRTDAAPEHQKRIALVDVDLFIPVLTFVFGEAQLGGIAAVVSTHRLSNHYYGLPRNDPLMLQRLEKEVVHELGHTFGLYHCRQFECVMRASTYVEEIDLKGARPCPRCMEKIRDSTFEIRDSTA